MNLQNFSVFVLKNTNDNLPKKKILFEISSVNENPQAPLFFSIVLHIFNLFAFSNKYISHLKKNHHLSKSV